jgi:hypothetical protein
MDAQNTALATQAGVGAAIEKVLVGGDLKDLTPEQRVSYYHETCKSLGLNPLTRPFDYLVLNNKTVLYARKDCTEQLRSNRKVSITIVAREVVEGCYVVTAKASDSEGRTDESIGAVPIDKMQGEPRANAMMKAETKAKRRVTLSFCGLGMLDETEVDSIPGAHAEIASSSPTPGASNGKPVVVDAEVVSGGSTTGDPKVADQKPPQNAAPKPGEKKPSPLKHLIGVLKAIGKEKAPDVLGWMTAQLKKEVKATKDLTEAEIATLTESANAILKETT